MVPMTHLRHPGGIGFWIPAFVGMTGYAKVSIAGEDGHRSHHVGLDNGYAQSRLGAAQGDGGEG